MHLDLFSGIGGFALASRWAGLTTMQFVEIEPYAQKILKKNFPEVPIHSDICTFSAVNIQRPFILTGSWPCQPFSRAGNQRSSSDDRYLWPEMLRIIRESRPCWIVSENVIEIVKMDLSKVLSDLENSGYSTQVFQIPACAVDAEHKRERIWLVSNTNSEQINNSFHESFAKGSKKTTSDFQNYWDNSCNSITMRQTRSFFKSRVDRISHGLPFRMDRMRCLGNSIVPAVAFQIISNIIKAQLKDF